MMRHRSSLSIAVGAVAALAPLLVTAHTRERPTPETVWSSWNVDPLVVIPLLFGTWLYLRGTGALWRHAGAGEGITRWQRTAFLMGTATIAVALVSPLDAMGGALFSAHMVQHLLLFLVSPMLLAMGRPAIALAWALPEDVRKRLLVATHRRPIVGKAGSIWDHPLAVWAVFTTVLWIWHVPAFYDAALRSDAVHAMEHATFVLAAFMFWSWLLRPAAGRHSRRGLAVLIVFTSVMQSGVLGALLTFAGTPLYEGHVPYAPQWHLTPLEDQQLAGLLMWIPMGLWFTATTILVFLAWLRDADRSVRQWEQGEAVRLEGR